MSPPTNKVDMAQMNAAIDKVLSIPTITQAELKDRRARREAERPPPSKSAKSSAKSTAR